MRPASVRPGVEQDHRPLVPKAQWRVTCNDCGAAFDSAAGGAEAAITEVAAPHESQHEHLSVEAADYIAHPLYAR